LALAATFALAACGGGSGNDDDEQGVPADVAIARFAQDIDGATGEKAAQNTQRCDPENGCPAILDESDVVVGKDLEMAITSPSTDVPGGAAFLEQAIPQQPMPDVPEPNIPATCFPFRVRQRRRRPRASRNWHPVPRP
jgi:hypothetical protein